LHCGHREKGYNRTMPDPADADPSSPAHQRRAKAAARREKRRQAMQALRLPLVSGKASALVLFLCFALAATLVYLLSAPLHLPAWVRWEIVVGAWWLVCGCWRWRTCCTGANA